MERKVTMHDFVRFCNNKDACQDCPLAYQNNGANHPCWEFVKRYTDEVNELILKWCDEHPAKTYADDFYEKFPNAERKSDNKTPNVCINRIYPHTVNNCDCYTCDLCWTKTYKEDTE